MMEWSLGGPTYVDVAIKRWEEFTASTALHVAGGNFAEIGQQLGVASEQNPAEVTP
jgi:hypothetical protein